MVMSPWKAQRFIPSKQADISVSFTLKGHAHHFHNFTVLCHPHKCGNTFKTHENHVFCSPFLNQVTLWPHGWNIYLFLLTHNPAFYLK
jgi:hypothetical protein